MKKLCKALLPFLALGCETEDREEYKKKQHKHSWRAYAQVVCDNEARDFYYSYAAQHKELKQADVNKVVAFIVDGNFYYNKDRVHALNERSYAAKIVEVKEYNQRVNEYNDQVRKDMDKHKLECRDFVDSLYKPEYDINKFSGRVMPLDMPRHKPEWEIKEALNDWRPGARKRAREGRKLFNDGGN